MNGVIIYHRKVNFINICMKRELYTVNIKTYTPLALYNVTSVNLVVKKVFPPIVSLKASIVWNIFTLGKIKAYCLYDTDDNTLIHKSLVVKSKIKFPFLSQNDIEIGPCWTNEKYRGNGYYPFVLSKIISSEVALWGQAYMIVNDENISSIRGITKVGFKKTGHIVSRDFFGRHIIYDES